MPELTVAFAKGRLLGPSIKIFESLGYDLRAAHDSRKLVIASNGAHFIDAHIRRAVLGINRRMWASSVRTRCAKAA